MLHAKCLGRALIRSKLSADINNPSLHCCSVSGVWCTLPGDCHLFAGKCQSRKWLITPGSRGPADLGYLALWTPDNCHRGLPCRGCLMIVSMTTVCCRNSKNREFYQAGFPCCHRVRLMLWSETIRMFVKIYECAIFWKLASASPTPSQ